MKKILNAAALGLLLLAGQTATAKPVKRKAAAATPAPGLWGNKITLSSDGTAVLGNPAAAVKVVEFISFTCSHCADFNQEAHSELRGTMVRTGRVSVELRPFLRNEFDLIASLMVMCGPKQKYFGNSDAVLAAQGNWFKEPADPGYKGRWTALEGNKPALRKLVARDTGLFKIMQARGFSAAQLDTCLADEAMAARLNAMTKTASETDKVLGTPSFKINGALQEVYGWPELKPLINSALAKRT